MEYLVAVDGSIEAENAVAYAGDVANAMDGAVTVVHVVNPTVYDVGGMEPISTLSDADQRLIVESIEDAEERAERLLEDAVNLAAAHTGDVGSELCYGDPVEEITALAEERDVDGIFVGHRGRSERTEAMVGSVAKGIVERSTVPVTVVR